MATMNNVASQLMATLEGLFDVAYRTPMWPPFPPSDAFDPKWNTADLAFSDRVLSAAGDLLSADPAGFDNATMAIVDLKGSLSSPRYAGFLDWSVEVDIYSTAKVCAMYAAYQLREDCRMLAKSHSEINDPTLVSQAVLSDSLAKWSDPGNPTYIQKIAQSPPILGNIFEFTQGANGWNVDFRWTSDSLTLYPAGIPSPADPAVIVPMRNALHNSAPDQLKFLEWLRLMIGFSGDRAAMFCIQNLGFSYIGALLQQTGLVDLNAGLGLWLSWDYAGHLGTGIGPVKTGASTLPVTGHAGNAQALAKFFTLLEQKKLVSAPACSEMNDLLDGNVWRGANTWLGEGIEASGSTICTKIGFIDTDHGYNDAGWIMYDTKNYVAVVLNAGPDADFANARIKLESCL